MATIKPQSNQQMALYAGFLLKVILSRHASTFSVCACAHRDNCSLFP